MSFIIGQLGGEKMNLSNFVKILCFSALLCSATVAQREILPGGGEKDLKDRNIKDRSIDLERVKRDAEKYGPKNTAAATPATKFQEIKEDFEGLQLRQDEIRKIYTSGKQVDMAHIAAVAGIMNESAVRLFGNLFPPAEKPRTKKKNKDQKDVKPSTAEPTTEPLPRDPRSLIVMQDDTLAAFVANPMFSNPQVTNVDDNALAQDQLKKLIRLTWALQGFAATKPN